MPEDNPTILEADPRRFMEIVGIDDRETRIAACRENFEDLITCEIARYGIFNYPEMIGPLAELYSKWVLYDKDENNRWKIYKIIQKFIISVDFISVNAFLPFIAQEISSRIVSSAVIDFVCLGPLTDNDEMSRVNDIIAMIEGCHIKNNGAAFGGLLHLGDRRISKLLWTVKDLLEKDEVQTALQCFTPYLHAAAIEFKLDWLEGMEGDIEDGLFGVIAGAFGREKRLSDAAFVQTGGRQFPVPRNPTPAQQAEARRLAGFMPVGEYAKRIAPRLYALERSEPPPRVMPAVLRYWGLDPATDPKDAARLDDRLPNANPSAATMASTRRPSEIEEIETEWFDGAGRIFLAWGILNPNGPTLYMIGERIEGDHSRIFYRWMHMLGGRTYLCPPEDREELTYEGVFHAAERIRNHLAANRLGTPFAVIPSFVIASSGDQEFINIAQRLMASDEASQQDWGRAVAYTRAFGDDFFARAGCEIRVLYDETRNRPAPTQSERDFLQFTEARYGHIPSFAQASPPPFKSSQITEALFLEWWRLIAPVAHSRSALGQFFEMWRGALSLLSDDMEVGSVSVNQVVNFLSNLNFMIPEEN